MILRSRDIFSVVPRSGDGVTAGGCCRLGGRGRRGGGSRRGRGLLRGLAPPSSTSCLRIRPPTPVPVTVARSTPCWVASLRTSGVTYAADRRRRLGRRRARRRRSRRGRRLQARAPWLLGSGVGSGSGSGSGSGASGLRLGLWFGARLGRFRLWLGLPVLRPAASTEHRDPTSASTAPTSTVSSSSTLISSSVPATGEGISVSTLSVETSSSGSSTATVVADLLQPAGHGALGDRLAQRGQRHRGALAAATAAVGRLADGCGLRLWLAPPPAPAAPPRPCSAPARARPPARAPAPASGSALGLAPGAEPAESPAPRLHSLSSPITREHRADLDGVVLVGLDLEQRARDRGGDLGVDLVGGDLQQRLVDRDAVADLLQPAGDGAFGDGLAEGGEGDFGGHGVPLAQC